MTTKQTPLQRLLRRKGACQDARDWVGRRSLSLAWRECPRGDWMMWLLPCVTGWTRDQLKRLTLDFMAQALEAARPVCGRELCWAEVEAAHRLVRDAIEGRGGLAAAESAAWGSAAWGSAAWGSAARSAAYAARSAAYAARSDVLSAAYAAESAAYAARSAAYAAWSAAYAAWSAAWSVQADMIRKHIPKVRFTATKKRGAK